MFGAFRAEADLERVERGFGESGLEGSGENAAGDFLGRRRCVGAGIEYGVKLALEGVAFVAGAVAIEGGLVDSVGVFFQGVEGVVPCEESGRVTGELLLVGLFGERLERGQDRSCCWARLTRKARTLCRTGSRSCNWMRLAR